MAPYSHFVRVVAAAVAVLVASDARAQTVPQQAASAQPSATHRVEWAPSAPRQGSVVRITVRRAPTAVVDTMRRDSAAGSGALDSLRVLLDTLALRPATDTLRPAGDSLRRPADSLRPADAAVRLAADSLRMLADSLRPALGSPAAPGDSGSHLRATLFGEPLHFRREPSGEYVAIAGIPVDAPESVAVVIVSTLEGRTDTITTRLRIRRTAYKMEQLTVAPRFGQRPDSALAARIAREQALAAAVSRQSHFTPRLWDGEFQRPRAARVTSAFGDGRQFNGAIQSRHMGLDLAGAVGAPVVATNRGVVALVGDFYYAGNAVYIDHGAGLVTAYFHLSAVDVAQGDTVTPGMRIGRVGATGRVTGPHLHWVARYGSVTVDPSTLLELTAVETPASRTAPPPRGSSRGATPPRAPARPRAVPPSRPASPPPVTDRHDDAAASVARSDPPTGGRAAA